jgi:hypothetical protein
VKTGITLPELIGEVRARAAAKVDYLADTHDKMELVKFDKATDGIGLAVLTAAGEFDVFQLTENAHRQVAAWTDIPWQYYGRMLKEYRDLMITNVNAIFKKEPGIRMVRTLDGKCRAFLSDKYRRLDNDVVLAKSLPAILGKDGSLPPTRVLQSRITDDDMRIKVMFTDDTLTQDIGDLPRANGRDTVKPGFEIGNSETGKGSLFVRGFFYRDYCENGCIYSFGEDTLSYTRHHLGGKLKVAAGISILSEETVRKDDAAIVSALSDVMRALGSREVVAKLGATLRAAKTSTTLERPQIAVQVLASEVGLRENELDLVLRNLIADGDLSQYGVLNAVTAVANLDDVGDERALELEEIGGQILTMNANQWLKIATAEKVPVRRAA